MQSRPRSDEGGYVALLTAVLMPVLLGCAAVGVDIANWYLQAERLQVAADAASLAGVPYLPDNTTDAFNRAKLVSARNGYQDAVGGALVSASVVPGYPTKLRVSVTQTVKNNFGFAIGVPTATITRTAVADYAGPVAMGSPCNGFGNDPDAGGRRNAFCTTDTPNLWASIAAPKSPKANGDAFQSGQCNTSDDGCPTKNQNTDYESDGYFYTVKLDKPVNDLQVEIFDPAFVAVDDACDSGDFGSGSSAATNAVNPFVTDASTRYAKGNDVTKTRCTGDQEFSGGSGSPMATQFTFRSPGASAWDFVNFPVVSGCQKTYQGYDGKLYDALNVTSVSTYRNDVAQNFRRWVTLCSVSSAPAGEYVIQVKTNGLGTDQYAGGNRFAMRAYSATSPASNKDISISGRGKMGIFTNAPGAQSSFHLAKALPTMAAQTLMIRLFDVGDASQDGQIYVEPPPDSNLTKFTNCTGTGPRTGALTNCSITANRKDFQGRWQTIMVPVPANYSCDLSTPGGCWVRLRYDYGSGTMPADTTSWQANITGDPVRLVE